MDWMYKKDELEQKEYLLGKKIGAIPTGAGPNTNVPSAYDIPGALFKFDNDRAQTRAESDMRAKMREDPLFQIREREEEVKKRVLQNPVKMREVQKQREKMLSKAKKAEKKAKKKKKKAADSSDDELLQQYLAALSKKESKESKRQDTDEWEERPSVTQRSEQEEPRAYGLLSRDGNSTQSKRSAEKRLSGKNSREKDTQKRRDHREHTHSQNEEKSRRERREGYSDGERRKERSQRESIRQRSPRRDRHRSRSPRHRSRSPRHSSRRKHSPEAKQKLSSADRDRKLREMMDNAAWRDEERASNVKRYAREEQKEQEHKGDFSEGYLNPMMTSHVSSSSLQERLRRNKFNIQRTSADLDKNSYQK